MPWGRIPAVRQQGSGQDLEGARPRTTAAPRATGRAPGAPEGPSGGPAPDDGRPWSASVPVNHNGTHQRRRLGSTPHPPSGSADRGGRAPSRCGSRSHQRPRPGPAADLAARRRRETPRPSGRPPPRHPRNLVHPIGLAEGVRWPPARRRTGRSGAGPGRCRRSRRADPPVPQQIRRPPRRQTAGRDRDRCGRHTREQEGWRGHQGPRRRSHEPPGGAQGKQVTGNHRDHVEDVTGLADLVDAIDVRALPGRNGRGGQRPRSRSPTSRPSDSPTKSLLDNDTSTGQPSATSSSRRRVHSTECQAFLPKSCAGSMTIRSFSTPAASARSACQVSDSMTEATTSSYRHDGGGSARVGRRCG